MQPVYDHAGVRLFCGDSLEVLRSLPDESVHACVTSPPYLGLRSYLPDGHPDKAKEIGVESLEAYIARLVEVFAEVRRVLRQDSTCWIVIGDSYSQGGGAQVLQTKNASHGLEGMRLQTPGIASKQLLGVPWRLAFALQAEGWWLRQDIVWSKPNVMPESVTDRCTRNHEYVFLLAKAERYFFDNEAIKEAQSENSHGGNGPNPGSKIMAVNHFGKPTLGQVATSTSSTGRNRRSVWTIPTGSFEGAHFAVYPEALVEPMILAGTSAAGCCPRCLAPYRRVVERVPILRGKDVERERNRGGRTDGFTKMPNGVAGVDSRTLGWQPGCSCDAGPAIPCTVIDPFVGSGTSVAVAKRLGRHGLGVDLSREYLALAERRLHQDVLPLGVV